ncbi:MAG: nickel-dependent hydrogenase large subunit, partial [Bacillota bacterium]
VVDAQSSGWLFRGFEQMLAGRPPLDATYFTERICGICSAAHSIASSTALENALAIYPSAHDQMLRGVIHGCEFLQNHLRHFYQYTLPDYIKGPNLAPLIPSSHQDYRLPSADNQRLVDHYLASVRHSRLAHEALAVLGGKAPHNHGNFVGGVTVNLDISKLTKVRSLIREIMAFIDGAMLDDVLTVARYYPEYYQMGASFGHLMSYGLYSSGLADVESYVSPQVLLDGNRLPLDPNLITENVRYAWYRSEQENLKPSDYDEAAPAYGKEDAYSWVKAPRYQGRPMEVGPLARMWLSGRYQRGLSAMDRTIARVLEASLIAHIVDQLLQAVEPHPAQQRAIEIPNQATGRGLVDTTRGSLGHWVAISDKVIDHYTIITPSGWNLSPKDVHGVRGVAEQALIGTVISDLERPVEIGRIVRSFDPCVSCATHVYGGGGAPITLEIL